MCSSRFSFPLLLLRNKEAVRSRSTLIPPLSPLPLIHGDVGEVEGRTRIRSYVGTSWPDPYGDEPFSPPSPSLTGPLFLL